MGFGRGPGFHIPIIRTNNTGIQTIDGVGPDGGGNVTLSSGDGSIVVTPNPGTHTIDIVTSAVSKAHMQSFQFGENDRVPGGGQLQLRAAGESLAELAVERAGLIAGATLNVDSVDVNGYDLQVRKNGVTVATLSLPVGQKTVSTSLLSVPVAVNDLLTLWLVRTSGSGSSAFRQIQATVELSS